MNLKVRGTKYLPAAGRRSTGLLAESIHVAKRIDIFPPLPSSHCFRHWRACRMSYFVFPTLYFVLGTLYFLMPNAQCRMVKWEILPMEQFRTSYLVFPTWYIVLCTSYKNEPFSPYLCTYSMGLTGFDSRCNHRARMQAGVCTALKDSCKRQMAKLLTPWLLNLT